MRDDTISRAAAIDAALTYLVEYCGAAFDEDMQRMLKERLDSLPSAQLSATDTNVVTTDTISRQAVIDTAEWVYKACEGNLSYYHDLLVAALMDLTPAQPVWIPCSERLPRAFETVNVTVQIQEGRYVKESALVNGVWQGINVYAEVVAWMPLPAPWEGEKG